MSSRHKRPLPLHLSTQSKTMDDYFGTAAGSPVEEPTAQTTFTTAKAAAVTRPKESTQLKKSSQPILVEYFGSTHCHTKLVPRVPGDLHCENNLFLRGHALLGADTVILGVVVGSSTPRGDVTAVIYGPALTPEGHQWQSCFKFRLSWGQTISCKYKS